MKKAYSYIRFSSPTQAQGDSYNRQRKATVEYCNKHNLKLVDNKEYVFFDAGVSAFKSAHAQGGQLNRFLNLVDSGDIEAGSVLIIESFDRLSRDKVGIALVQFLSLISKGIEIVTLTDNMRYGVETLDNSTQLLISIMVMSRAHEESTTKSKRVFAAWDKKKLEAREDKTPISPTCPMWLKVTKSGYEVIKERGEVVKRIFELTVNGYGKQKVMGILNREGIPSFKGKTWGISSVDKVLNNRAVFGEYQPHTKHGKTKREPTGEAIRGFYPVVVLESLFYEALAATSGRRISKTTAPTRRFNVWSKVAFCTDCGSAMSYVNKGDSSKGGKYLQCYESVKRGNCDNKKIRLDDTEIVFMKILGKIDNLSLVKKSGERVEKKILEVEGRLLETKSMHTKYFAAFEETASTTALAMVDKAIEDIKRLEAELEGYKIELASGEEVAREDFYNLVDLESFEGRAKANRLLLRLDIKIDIVRDEDIAFYHIKEHVLFVQYLKINKVIEVPLNKEGLRKFMDNASEVEIKQTLHIIKTLKEGGDSVFKDLLAEGFESDWLNSFI